MLSRRTLGGRRRMLEYGVDNAQRLRFLRVEECVAFHLGQQCFVRRFRMLGINFSQLLFQLENLFRLNLDVGGLTLRPTRRLMNHNPCIWQRVTHSGCSGSQQQRTHGTGLANAPRGDRRFHVLHRVINGQASRHAASG